MNDPYEALRLRNQLCFPLYLCSKEITRRYQPMLDELAEGNTAYKIVSIDIDDEDELADEYDVSSIPCLVVFKGGEEVNRSVGLIPKDAIAELVEG